MGTTRQPSYESRPAGSAAADEIVRADIQLRSGDERRIHADRRVRYDRREMIRRTNPMDDPGPPTGVAERRLEERRKLRRRRSGDGTGLSPWSVAQSGWVE